MANRNLLNILPFNGLTDYQLEVEFISMQAAVRNRFDVAEIFSRLEYDSEISHIIDCDYYDEDSFNDKTKDINIGC